MKRAWFAAILVVLSAVAAGAASAQPTLAGMPACLTGSITLYPVADAWVNYYLPNNNYGSSTQLKIGSEQCPGQEFPDRGRTLIRFDLSAIPPGQVIQSATLHLYLRYAVPEGATTNTVNVHRVTAAWTEAGTTWNSQPGDSPTVYASIPVGLTTGAWYSCDVTQLVREWYEGTYSNYGFKLVSTAETTCNMRQFDSRENTYDPRLVITYGTPTPSPTHTHTPTLTPTQTRTPTRTATPTRTPSRRLCLPLLLRSH